MNYLVYKYAGKARDLRKMILAILKSGLADEVYKMNYVHNYLLKDNKVNRGDVQLFMVHSDNEDKLNDFLVNNFSGVERIYLK